MITLITDFIMQLIFACSIAAWFSLHGWYRGFWSLKSKDKADFAIALLGPIWLIVGVVFAIMSYL